MKERFQEIEEKSNLLRKVLTQKTSEVQDFLERFEVSWVYHDNAIDGTVYSTKELQAALHPGAVAAEANIVPIVLEIRNHKTAIEFIRHEAAKPTGKKGLPMTVSLVKHVHDLICGNTPEAQEARAAIERRERSDKEIAKEKERMGYRRDMPLHRTYFHEIAQPKNILPMLEKLCDSTHSAEFRDLHPIVQAARVQHGLIQIFPFTENSGRVGRMMSNMYLIRANFLPAVMHATDRQKYYEAFRGTPATFANTLMDAIENSIDNGLKHFTELKRKFKVVTF